MAGEKARSELHKNAACCFGHLLKAALYKRVAVQLLNFHPPNHS